MSQFLDPAIRKTRGTRQTPMVRMQEDAGKGSLLKQTTSRTTGEYYAKMNIPNPTSCSCDHQTFQTRDHLIRHCPLYDKSRDRILMPAFPRLQNPRFSLGSLFRRKNHPLLLAWLEDSGAFTKAGIPWDTTPWKPPWSVPSNLSPFAEPFVPRFRPFLGLNGCSYPL